MLDLLVVLVLLVDSKQNETVQKAVSFFSQKKFDEYLYLSKNCSTFALAMQKVALINKL